MADLDVSKPRQPPKPVQIGGESLADRLLPHLKKIIVGVLVVAFIVTVILAVRWWKHRGQEKETAQIAEVIRDVAQRPIALPGEKPDPKAKEKTYAEPADRAKAVLEELGKRGVSPPGHAYRAGLLLEAGNVDQAIEEYRRGQGEKGFEGVVSREGLGLALEQKGLAEKDAAARDKLFAEALEVFQRMQPDEQGPRRVYAVYHQARVQAALGKTAEAKTLFEQAKDLLKAEERHELRELIEKRLAALGAG